MAESDESLGSISGRGEPCSAAQVEDNVVAAVCSIGDIEDGGTWEKGVSIARGDGSMETDRNLGSISDGAEPSSSATQIEDGIVDEDVAGKGKESPGIEDSRAVGETSRHMETDVVCLISDGGAEPCLFLQEDVGRDSDSMEANGSLSLISQETELCSATQVEDDVFVVDGVGNKEEEKVDGDGSMNTADSAVERVSPRREDSDAIEETSRNMETDADLLSTSLKEGLGINSDDLQTVEKITGTEGSEGSLVDESRDKNQEDSILSLTLDDAAVVGEREEEKLIGDESTDKEEKKAINDDSAENRDSIIDAEADSYIKDDSFASVAKGIIDDDVQANEKITSTDVGIGSFIDESRDRNQEDPFMGVTLDSAVAGEKEENKVVHDDLIEKEEKKVIEDDSAENSNSLIDAKSSEKDDYAIVETKKVDPCISSQEQKHVDPKSQLEEDQSFQAEAQNFLDEQEKTMSTDVVKKRRGRPRKKRRFLRDASGQKSLSRQQDEENVCHLDTATPVASGKQSGKRRGRPPKKREPKDHNDDQTSPSKQEDVFCQIDNSSLVSSSGEYRKKLRSRPPKHHVAYVSQASAKRRKTVDSDSSRLERSNMSRDLKNETPSSENVEDCANQVASQTKE